MTQLNREDWLKEGLMQLVTLGVDALTIDVMCKVMGVTKGSFYHHFKNRRMFQKALLEYWEDTYTTKFIEFSEGADSPQEKLKRLSVQVIETHNTYENTIRAWAQVDDLAREYQQRVDQRRLEFLYDLYRQLSGDEEHARTMAHLAYTTLIGAAQILPPLRKAELAAMYSKLTLLNFPEGEA